MTNLAYQLEINESIKVLHNVQKKNVGKRIKIGNKYYRLNMTHYRVYKAIWNVLQGLCCVSGAVALYMLMVMYGGV